MRIGVLGGSVDPIHQGHLMLARESEKQFQLDKILFVPNRTSPHKPEEALTPAPHRARMIELAIQGHPAWECSDLEFRRSGPSYTLETLRELRELYPPPHEIFFIAGADSFAELETWKQPEEILRLSEWIVAPRPEIPLPEKLPARFHRLQVSPVPVSATGLRGKLKRGERVPEWIPDPVAGYIQKMNLYRN